MILELSAPHNWCDRCCERCVLEDECPVPERERSRPQKDWVAAVTADLKEAVAMLEEIAAEQGISLDELTPPPPPSIDATLLMRAAAEYGRRLRELASDALIASFLVETKIRRIAGYLEDDVASEGAWAMDGVPNLLLIEKLLDDVRNKLGAPAGRLADSERTLRALLTPLLETIPPVTRIAMAALVSARRAPSPFVRK